MSTKGANNQKMGKNLLRETVDEAQAEMYATDARIRRSRITEVILQWNAATKLKLEELGENSDGAWKRMGDT